LCFVCRRENPGGVDWKGENVCQLDLMDMGNKKKKLLLVGASSIGVPSFGLEKGGGKTSRRLQRPGWRD
jgi:hypothetical protein